MAAGSPGGTWGCDGAAAATSGPALHWEPPPKSSTPTQNLAPAGPQSVPSSPIPEPTGDRQCLSTPEPAPNLSPVCGGGPKWAKLPPLPSPQAGAGAAAAWDLPVAGPEPGKFGSGPAPLQLRPRPLQHAAAKPPGSSARSRPRSSGVLTAPCSSLTSTQRVFFTLFFPLEPFGGSDPLGAVLGWQGREQLPAQTPWGR